MYRTHRKLTLWQILFLCTSCLCCVLYLLQPSKALPAFSYGTQSFDCIILDAGHGGEDGGAIGIHGELEKDINLAITLQLQALLQWQGVDVILTRDSDRSIHDPGCNTLSQKKVSDIHNRLALMESHPNALVVSIHQNKFEEAKYSGAQMFYGVKNPLSPVLAQSIQDAFFALQPDNTRQIKKGTESVYLLCHASAPIVLVECGFLSNEEEAYLLSTEDYQKKVAFSIYSGLMQFLQSDPPEGEQSN